MTGIAAYALAMIATVPATAVLHGRPWHPGVAGTIWHGEAGVAGGSRLTWTWAPLRSLTSLGFAADWHAIGPATDLDGQAVLRPGGTALDAVSGHADAMLLMAVLPDLPFTCAMPMQMEFPAVRIGGGMQRIEGRLLTGAGTCTALAAGAAPTPVAPMILTADTIGTESRLRLAPAAQRRRTLMTLVVSEGGPVRVEMTPAGAIALPFAGMPAGASAEREF